MVTFERIAAGNGCRQHYVVDVFFKSLLFLGFFLSVQIFFGNVAGRDPFLV